MRARGTALILVVSLEVLLHVVGTGKLLLAARKSALDSLLGGVDLGMARGVARGGECLFASVSVAVPAGVPLSGSLGNGRRPRLANHLSVVGGRAAAVGVGSLLGVEAVVVRNSIHGLMS